MGVVSDDEGQFQCPGEPQSISWTVHVGRLAAYYWKCRDCRHRFATGSLSPRQVERLAQTHAARPTAAEPHLDGVAVQYRGQLDNPAIRQLAIAVGSALAQDRDNSTTRPIVVVGGHGRGLPAEMTGPVGDGLRWSGCDAIDVGHVSSPCLIAAIEHLRADGGVYVGGFPEDPRAARISIWGPRARPVSVGSGMEQFEPHGRNAQARHVRRAGATRRWRADDVYLAALKNDFHALRPLRFVIQTACTPLLRHLESLTGQVGCQIIADESMSDWRHTAVQISREVQRQRAHFGFWIDADGESCRVFDEHGIAVPPERFLLLLAGNHLRARPDGVIVLERDTPDDVGEAILDAGGSVVAAGPTRAEMAACLRDRGGHLGGGPSGRYWTTSPLPVADALKTLSILLNILSTSDAPLSEVAADCLRSGGQSG